MRAVCRDFADTHDLLVQAHLSETRQEHEECRQATGKTPAEVFAAEGLLHDRFVGAHGVWLTDSDRALLAAHGAAIAHCPSSNTKLASGAFDEPAARRANLRFGLGTDGAARRGRITFPRDARGADWPGDGVATLVPEPDALVCRIEASAPGQLAGLKDAVARHIDRFAFREAPLTYDWRDEPA